MAAFQRIFDYHPGRGRISGEHLGAVHGSEDTAGITAAARSGETVSHHVVSIGPDADVRIITEVSQGHREGVTGVGSGSVGGSGDSDALIVRVVNGIRRGGKLRDQPA